MTTAAVAIARAVGRSEIALDGNPLGVAGAAAAAMATATTGVAGDIGVEVGGLQGPEILVGTLVQSWLDPRLPKKEGITNYTLSSWSPLLIVSHQTFLFRW